MKFKIGYENFKGRSSFIALVRNLTTGYSEKKSGRYKINFLFVKKKQKTKKPASNFNPGLALLGL